MKIAKILLPVLIIGFFVINVLTPDTVQRHWFSLHTNALAKTSEVKWAMWRCGYREAHPKSINMLFDVPKQPDRNASSEERARHREALNTHFDDFRATFKKEMEPMNQAIACMEGLGFINTHIAVARGLIDEAEYHKPVLH